MSRVILDRDELKREVETLRAQGKTIVFANGAFDLLHPGHVRFLKAAAQEGDVLVVGLNTDESIRKYKGPDRPVQPLSDRLEVVSALIPVDIATAFDEPTADNIIDRIRPDVHAKGLDYTLETLPEGPTLERLGIRLACVGDEKNYSSTQLIERAADAAGST
ncbi:MAG: adenylyltransferase/cytidyltransferase family protein [Planctomycetota bacterium]|nr:MAG: adenylyltransferase/cytidyltransferase family protein [Planctomycetota bacterium]